MKKLIFVESRDASTVRGVVGAVNDIVIVCENGKLVIILVLRGTFPNKVYKF